MFTVDGGWVDACACVQKVRWRGQTGVVYKGDSGCLLRLRCIFLYEGIIQACFTRLGVTQ